MDIELAELSGRVGEALRRRSESLVTAESCTGGWVAQVVTHVAGSSAWFERGFVTYANEAKTEMLGVRADTLAQHGAVSLETVGEMAIGALERSNASFSLAISGIAGPTGGSPDKPVGTVCFSWCRRGETPNNEWCRFDGDREAVRRQSVIHALSGLLARIAEREESTGAITVP
jgi:nicotinamide-nucleotide amidase